MKFNKQSGNVLFLILIAVALFAALAYAVTKSSRSSGGSAKKEQLSTTASTILNHAASIRSAMLRMKISNNCADDQFDFSNTVYKLADGNPLNVANANAPASGKCKLFSPSGGGVSAVLFSPANFDFTPGYDATPGHTLMRVAQVPGSGTDNVGAASANDLIMAIMYLKKDLCMAVNDLLKVNNPSGAPPNGPWRSDGDYSNGSFAGNAQYTDAAVSGKGSFCVFDGNQYEFIQVLLSR